MDPPKKKARRIRTCFFLADTKSMHVFFVWLIKFVWLFWFGSESGKFGTCQKGLFGRSQPSHDIHPKLTAQKTHGAGVKCIFFVGFCLRQFASKIFFAGWKSWGFSALSKERRCCEGFYVKKPTGRSGWNLWVVFFVLDHVVRAIWYTFRLYLLGGWFQTVFMVTPIPSKNDAI